MRKRRVLLILALALILLSPSCVFRSEYEFDQTCEAPCWKGLEIGMSIEEILAKLDELDGYTITYKLPTSISLENKRGEINQLFFSESLMTIVLGIRESKIRFPLSTLIEELGEPDYIIPMYAGFSNDRLNAVLCYPKRGVVVELVGQRMEKDESGHGLLRVNEFSKVQYLAYDILDPNTSGIAVNYCKSPLEGTVQQDWKGYGVYTNNGLK